MFDFLRDTWQDEKIRHARTESTAARDRANDVANDSLFQQQQIDHLTLLCQSMWELLRETTGLTDVQLRKKVAAVDSRDGKSDGKISKRVISCPKCGKNCSSSSRHCAMCGVDLRLHKPNIFEG